MFFEEEFDYGIIDDTVTDDFLQEWCNENDIYLEIVDNPTRWCAFSQWYGRTNGLDAFASTSFAYIISMVMTGMGVSAGIGLYYKDDKILDFALELIESHRKVKFDELKNAKATFDFVFLEYKLRLFKYEIKTESVSVRMGISTYLKFQEVAGDNNTDKFFEMLSHYTGTEFKK